MTNLKGITGFHRGRWVGIRPGGFGRKFFQPELLVAEGTPFAKRKDDFATGALDRPDGGREPVFLI